MRAQGRAFAGAVELRRGAGAWLLAHVEAAAVAGARHPVRALALLAAANLAAAGAFVLAGLAAGDQALMFRELAPGTWLSFTQLAFVAWLARELHRASAPGGPLRTTFWGLSAAVFALLALDEILQGSQFLGTWLNQGAGLDPASGFNDLGAVLLTLLFAGCALTLAPRALVLLRHPAVLATLALAALLGAGSQALDSFVAPTRWEFVAEETLKLLAEAAFVGAFLMAWRDAERQRRETPA